MAVLDVAELQEELSTGRPNWKLTTDKLGNPGFNVRDLSDNDTEFLHFVKKVCYAGKNLKTIVKRSGTGLRVTFYKE